MSGANLRLDRRQLLGVGAGTVAAAAAARLPAGGRVEAAAGLQAADVPREETLILVGVGGESPNEFTDVEQINPLLGVGANLSRSGFHIMYEPLAFYSMLAGTETMWLAESYAYNADFTQIDVKIRSGVEWSDGTPFTANDVAFTINLLRDDAGTLFLSTEMKQWVKEAVVVDDLNLQIQLNASNPRFFFLYFTNHADNGMFIVPKHIFEGQDIPTFTNFDLAAGWPIVTGPYRLVASNTQQKVWDRRDDWWAAKTGFAQLPAPRRLIFLPGFGETKMAQMIIANEADASLNISPATMPTLWAQNPKITTHSGHEPPYGYIDWWPSGLGFNCEKAPWDNPSVRWAVSYAVDREQLVEFGYRGAGEPTVLPYPYYPPLLEYIDAAADLLAQYPTNAFDLAKSEALMTEAGFAKDGDGFWAKDGQRLSIVITTFEVFADLAPFVTEQLQKAGFDASFQMPTTFINDLMAGSADVYIWGHGGSVRDPFKTMELYHQKFVKPTGEATYPFYRWRNDEYDAIVDEMGLTAPDDPRTTELFLQGTEIWLRELPDPPLLQFYHRIPLNTTYWTGWPSKDDPYMNEAFWHRTFLQVLLRLQPAAS